jgi:hypothetical protein
MGKEQFREKYGEVPNKTDLTILVPKADDPVQQVRHATRLHPGSRAHRAKLWRPAS